MAKNFNNATKDNIIINADEILIGQAGGDDVVTPISEVKRFIKQSLDTNFKNGLIIPMYIYPTDAYTNSEYNAIIAFKRANRSIPMVVILNPSSGPGTVTDGNYTMVIDRMKAVGISVIGYVSTAFGVTTITAVKADIDTWKSLYPGINGIFFDEQSDGTTNLATEQAYYREAAEHSRLIGLDITVSNPGKEVAKSWHDLVDIIVEWENNVYPTTGTMDGAWPGGKPLNKRAALVHTTTTGAITTGDSAIFGEMIQFYGWVYVTADVMPNPWNSVSAEIQDMYDAIG